MDFGKMLILGIVGTFVLMILILAALSPGGYLSQIFGGGTPENVSCGYCQYGKNGVCVSWPCCEDKHCLDNQYCAPPHTCYDLKCGWHQITLNHKCVDVDCVADADCRGDSICVNNTCSMLGCPEGLQAINHGCYSKECKNDQSCKDSEACRNGVCQVLECGYCSYVESHRCMFWWCCEDKDCGSLGKCEGHNCTVFECGPNQFLHEGTNRCRDIVCMKDADCNDKKDWTEDICVDAGTRAARCDNPLKVVSVSLGKGFKLRLEQTAAYSAESAEVTLIDAYDNGAKIKIKYHGSERGTKSLTLGNFKPEQFIDNVNIWEDEHCINIKLTASSSKGEASLTITKPKGC